jgi:hypothetical protein
VFVLRSEDYRYSEKNNFYQSVAIHKNNLGKKGLNIFENLNNEILNSPKIFTLQHHKNAHFLWPFPS